MKVHLIYTCKDNLNSRSCLGHRPEGVLVAFFAFSLAKGCHLKQSTLEISLYLKHPVDGIGTKY